ncbi:hypothetical protein CGRA01v4_06699 [Colletotrichum graminicola]|nr:hypothetical protein CGRA01v4_06699 [Colletotrichum graminicola]
MLRVCQRHRERANAVSTPQDIGVRGPLRSRLPSLPGEGLKTGSPESREPAVRRTNDPPDRPYGAGLCELVPWRAGCDGLWRLANRHRPVMRIIIFLFFYSFYRVSTPTSPSPWMVFITTFIYWLSGCELEPFFLLLLFSFMLCSSREKPCPSVSSTRAYIRLVTICDVLPHMQQTKRNLRESVFRRPFLGDLRKKTTSKFCFVVFARDMKAAIVHTPFGFGTVFGYANRDVLLL